MEKPTFLKGTPKPSAQDRDRLFHILANWTTLTGSLDQMDETEVAQAILLEATTRQRASILIRLKSRFNTVRRDREWRELVDFTVLARREAIGPRQ